MRKVMISYKTHPITLSQLKWMDYTNNTPLSYRLTGKLFDGTISTGQDVQRRMANDYYTW
jgi:hypothetical protein